jgi:hypothetical protein
MSPIDNDAIRLDRIRNLCAALDAALTQAQGICHDLIAAEALRETEAAAFRRTHPPRTITVPALPIVTALLRTRLSVANDSPRRSLIKRPRDWAAQRSSRAHQRTPRE